MVREGREKCREKCRDRSGPSYSCDFIRRSVSRQLQGSFHPIYTAITVTSCIRFRNLIPADGKNFDEAAANFGSLKILEISLIFDVSLCPRHNAVSLDYSRISLRYRRKSS